MYPFSPLSVLFFVFFLSCQRVSYQGFPGWSVVKNMSAMQEPQEMWVWSLGREDLLEEGMATYSSILAWRISQTEAHGGLQSTGSQKNWMWLKQLSMRAQVPFPALPHHSTTQHLTKHLTQPWSQCTGLTETDMGQNWTWWLQIMVSWPLATAWSHDSCLQMFKPFSRPQVWQSYCWKPKLCNEVKTDFIDLIFIEDIFKDAWIF